MITRYRWGLKHQFTSMRYQYALEQTAARKNIHAGATPTGIRSDRPHGTESRLTSRYLKDFKQEGGVPACSLASCLDASLGLIGTDEIEGEAAQDGHILRAVAGPVA